MIWLYVAIIILAFPVGYLLSYLARDELVAGRKWFYSLTIVSLVVAAMLGFINFAFKLPSIFALVFMIIISLIAVWKSHDKMFVK